MAGSVNKVIILGRLAADPELKYIPSGQAVCTLRVATSEKYRDRNEQMQERTEWHNIVIWGKTAENYVAKVGRKGMMIHVIGKLQTRSWDDKEGKKQYRTEIVSEEVTLIATAPHAESQGDREPARGGGRSQGGAGAGPSGQQRMSQGYEPAADDFSGEEDSIPF